jgi:hypothetical protein
MKKMKRGGGLIVGRGVEETGRDGDRGEHAPPDTPRDLFAASLPSCLDSICISLFAIPLPKKFPAIPLSRTKSFLSLRVLPHINTSCAA